LAILSAKGGDNNNGGAGMIKHLNERIKTLTVWDMSLVKWSVLFATIIIVKLFPQLLSINYPVLVVFMTACMARPIYKIWIKK